MAALMTRMSSLLKTLKPKTPARANPPASPTQAPGSPPPITETELRSFDGRQLADFITQQPERTVIRLLQSLTDPDLQIRIIQAVSDEPTLKRITRIELNKKVKRAAERILRTTGSAAEELRIQKLARFNQELRSFLAAPRWPERDDARELLSLAFSPEFLDGPIDETSTTYTDFRDLRARLKREANEYDRTCAEMEEISQQLESSHALSKSSVVKLQERWTDLSTKYAFPKELSRIGPAKTERRPAPAQPPVTASAPPHPTREEREAHDRRRKEQAERQEKSRRDRLAAVESFMARIREVEKNLAHRQAGPALRELQNEAASLRRWRQEYPAQLDEAEALLKTLSGKRTEAVDEAKWDAWARTDLAIRIQTELEQIISGLETEQDPAIALKNSVGLTARLYEYANEMRALGSLERGKDHKIWQQFKSLSDRGWAVCDKMRLLVLEQAKAVLSEHAGKPVEFTAAALSVPRVSITFKISAFAPEVSTRIKELRSMWLEIGAKPSAANRALEVIFTKLFEIYFGQLNLHLGRQQKVENAAIQLKRDLLRDMKIACEGKSTLISRVRVAKGLEDKWKRAPMPASAAEQLQAEFERYQTEINAQLTAETERHLALVTGIQTRVREVLDRILARNGAGLSQALREVSGLEAELSGMEKHLGQFKGLRQGVPVAQTAEKTFQELRGQAAALIQECKAAAAKETQERATERNHVLLEAEELALSTDWDASSARFEELRALWKKSGVLGQSQDAMYALVFENVWAFYRSRFAAKNRTFDSKQLTECLSTREELIYSLEALTRFGAKQTNLLPLPFDEQTSAKASGKILEFGMKYKHVLSLDPKTGTFKETRKIMERWAGTVGNDESLPAVWKFYLNRVHALLEISSS